MQRGLPFLNLIHTDPDRLRQRNPHSYNPLNSVFTLADIDTDSHVNADFDEVFILHRDKPNHRFSLDVIPISSVSISVSVKIS